LSERAWRPALPVASVIAGLLMAWAPILIVWGAIFLFHTMEQTGAMETIRRWLNALSRNRVAQVVIIGWSFQFLIEGASGFGTPAALAGPLLVGLGFPPLRVAMACLILNSVPVSFGAVGTPTWFGFASLKLSPGELHAVAWKTTVIHCAAACVVPLMAFRLLLSWQEIRRNLLFIYLAIAASVVPMVLLALMNDEFPAVAGGMIGLLITVCLACRRVGLIDASHRRNTCDISAIGGQSPVSAVGHGAGVIGHQNSTARTAGVVNDRLAGVGNSSEPPWCFLHQPRTGAASSQYSGD
jgi:lactate permease